MTPPLKGGPTQGLLCLLTVLAFLVGAVTAAGPVAASTGAPDGGDFYQYPSQETLERTSPGEILASEPMTVSSDLRSASSQAVRIMYRSVGLHGKPIAVTGFLLLPRGDTPPGGWPVTAWGHGTTGVGPVCAPSRQANLYPYSDTDQYAERDAVVSLRRFVGTLEPATGRSTGPILLLQGGQDQTVPVAGTTTLNTQLCGFGDVVDYRIYPDADHESVLSAASKDMAAWMRERLQGHQAPSTCPPRAT